MKPILLGLFIFGSVLLVSAALPEDITKDRQSLLDEDSNPGNEKHLQRRRPPIKVPGPKLKKEDEETSEKPTGGESSDEDKEKKNGKKNVSLTKDHKNPKHFAPLDDDSKKGEKGKRGRGKDKDLVRKDDHEPDNEETQEERNVTTS